VPELDGGRRAARRSQTIDEILSIAVELMGEYGVAGLSLSEVARRLGIQPPSLYKYFPSRWPSTTGHSTTGTRGIWPSSAPRRPPPRPGWPR
jgi:hypothetical protein